MDQNKKTPQVRFKGYTDTWEQRKFSDIVQIERGGSPRPIDDYITDSQDGLNWVKIGDAPTQGHYITNTAEKIKPEGLSKTREVHPGDLILSNSMSFGKPYIMGIDGCIHDGWLLIRDTNKAFDLTFLCHLLGTPQMIDQYRSFAAGSTVNNLNKELVGNTIVTIPKLDEQRVVGQYLERLDNLITLHQCKYDKLLNLKKAMLEKMFPQNSSLYPEIRFKGFTDAWELRKLGDEFERVNERNDGSFGINHWISVAKMYFQEPEKVTSNNLDTRTYVMRVGDIAFEGHPNKEFMFGRLVANDIGDGIISELFPIYRHKQKYYNLYWKYAIQFEGTMRPIFAKAITSSGASSNKLNDEHFLREVILVPSLEEQTKIGDFFHILDNLITLHQRKLEKLKNIKKACLEKMFV